MGASDGFADAEIQEIHAVCGAICHALGAAYRREKELGRSRLFEIRRSGVQGNRLDYAEDQPKRLPSRRPNPMMSSMSSMTGVYHDLEITQR